MGLGLLILGRSTSSPSHDIMREGFLSSVQPDSNFVNRIGFASPVARRRGGAPAAGSDLTMLILDPSIEVGRILDKRSFEE